MLGSTRTQGFVTQQVTHWLNAVNGIAIVLMLIESAVGWKSSHRWWRIVQLALVVTIAGLLIGLVVLHTIMDEMIILDEEMITDEVKFYGLHRIYLWASTVQWVAAWGWIPISIASWRNADGLPRNKKT